MKRLSGTERNTDDKTCKAETGRSREEWFKLIDKANVTGRAAVGKLLLAEKVDAWWTGVLTVEHEAKHGVVEKDGRPKGYSICSTKSVNASGARTYKALTTAADLAAWFGAGATIDAAEGGQLRNRDGVKGAVRKLRPGKALVFSWDTPDFANGSQVEILVQEKGAKTGLVVNHTRIATRRDADDLRAAWEAALNKLKGHLED